MTLETSRAVMFAHTLANVEGYLQNEREDASCVTKAVLFPYVHSLPNVRSSWQCHSLLMNAWHSLVHC